MMAPSNATLAPAQAQAGINRDMSRSQMAHAVLFSSFLFILMFNQSFQPRL